MTTDEIKALSDEEFNELRAAVTNETIRREAVSSLREKVKGSVKEYKGWGGAPSDLLDLLEDDPETLPEVDGVPDEAKEPEETVDPVVEVEPEIPAETPVEDQHDGLTW